VEKQNMAIIVTCHCGKQLRVNDEFAGRHVKCPACQSVVAVPAGGLNAVTTPSPPRSQARAGEAIRFACDCGKQMQAKSEHAGKKTKCPDCGAVLTIPGAGGHSDSFDSGDQGHITDRAGRTDPRRQAAAEDDYDREAPHSRRPAAARGKRAVWPWVVGIVAVLLLVGGGLGWFFFLRGKTSPDLALVPRDAVGFVSVRVGDWLKTDSGNDLAKVLALNPQMAKMEEKTGLKLADIERVTFVMPTEKADDSWAVVSFSKPFDEDKILAALPLYKEMMAGEKTYYVSFGTALYFASSTILIAGAPETIKKYLENKSAPSQSGPLSDALALAEDTKYHIVAGAQIPSSLRSRLKSGPGGFGDRPPMGGIGPKDYEPFLDLQSATFTAILGGKTDLDLRLTFSSSDNAGKVKTAIDGFKSFAPLFLGQVKARLPQAGPGATQRNEAIFNQVEQALKSIKVEQEGSTVHVPMTVNIDVAKSAAAALRPLLEKVPGGVDDVRLAAAKVQSLNNLRQLGLAMHAYQDNYHKLPPANFRGGLSWRVALLPYVEQQPLYNQFHLNEPWDSPHNKTLLDRIPKVFAPPPGSAALPNHTFYQVFVGPQAPFNDRLEPTFASFRDGTSNTFLIVEAGRAVPWTKPEDIVYDANQPLPQLGGIFRGGFNAVMGDAAGVWVNRTLVNDNTIRALITPAGGEALPGNWQTGGR
jgi:hypothetical protein